MRRARGLLPATAFLGTLVPALASACAVCGGGPDRTRVAFLISTGFLSLLPLGLIFGGLIWLRRHARAALRDEFIDRDDQAIAAASRARGDALPAAPAAPAFLADSGARARV